MHDPIPPRPPDHEHRDPGRTQLRLAYDRTHLANERTFAAWIRTGLAIAAAGIAAAHIVPAAERERVTLSIGAVFVLLGAAIVVFGAWRFLQVARDLQELRSAHAPVHPWMVYLLTFVMVGVMLAGLLVV